MAVKPKWLYVSVPAGNAIQAFGYGIDNTQNKSGPVPGPSATPKPDPVSTQEISENLPVTIPKVKGSHCFITWDILHVDVTSDGKM